MGPGWLWVLDHDFLATPASLPGLSGKGEAVTASIQVSALPSACSIAPQGSALPNRAMTFHQACLLPLKVTGESYGDDFRSDQRDNITCPWW